MTPKEKAQELVEKFKNRSIELGETHSQLMAEANALIAVDEIIRVCPYISKNNCRTIEQFRADDIEFASYWKEVKQEIEKL